MQDLRLAWSEDNAISQKSIRKMMYAEKIYTGITKLCVGTKSGLTQMSQTVVAALKHVHCWPEVAHFLEPVARRCHFVRSSHGRRRLQGWETRLLACLNLHLAFAC